MSVLPSSIVFPPFDDAFESQWDIVFVVTSTMIWTEHCGSHFSTSVSSNMLAINKDSNLHVFMIKINAQFKF